VIRPKTVYGGVSISNMATLLLKNVFLLRIKQQRFGRLWS